MQTPDSEKIVRRFFEALAILQERRYIRGKQTFTSRYGINRWNMNTLEKEPHRDIFQPAWLEYLVRDYGLSPKWLLTGKGNVFTNEQTTQRLVAAEAKRRKAARESVKQKKEDVVRKAEADARRAEAAQRAAETAKLRASKALEAAEKAKMKAEEAKKVAARAQKAAAKAAERDKEQNT